MDPLIISIIMLVFLVIGIFSGIYIGVVLAFLSVVGMWWMFGNMDSAIHNLASASFQTIRDYIFGVVPFFVLMGLFANVSGASDDLYRIAYRFLGRIRGGLGIATVAANAVFAAITGVSVASAAVFSKIALPQMLRYGYDKRFALGTVAGSSVLGMLIPPSILFIIYGVLTEEAIGRLFMAGVVPGLILAVIYAIGIFVMVALRPRWGGVIPPQETLGCVGWLKEIASGWEVFGLVFVTLGGIYMGWFTPTEAGAVGAFGAFVLILINRRFKWNRFWGTLVEAGYTTTSIFFLLITAQTFSRMLTLGGLISKFSEVAMGMDIPPFAILALFMFILVVLGCFIDSASILLITIPLMVPVVEVFHYNPIWWGVVTVMTVEIGILTPPFGLVVFAMKAALGDEAKIEDIFVGSFPFWGMIAVSIAIVFAFPVLSTWLPSRM